MLISAIDLRPGRLAPATKVLEGYPWQLVSRDLDLDQAMDRYAEGDDRAFAVLHAGLYPRLRAYLTRLSRSPVLAEDLVQETFLRVHRARGTFAREAAVVPWVYAIARNLWIEHARNVRTRAAGRTQSLDDDEASVHPLAGPETDSEQALAAREAAAIVDQVLGDLPIAQREAFLLLRYEGLSVQEAAGVVGCTEGALKLRAFRAYEALRAALHGASAESANARGGTDG